MLDKKVQTVKQIASNNTDCIIIQSGIGGSSTNIPEILIERLKSADGDIKLLNKLVKEQISLYESKIFANEYGAVLSLCNALLSFNPSDIDPKILEKLHWLQFIAAFYTDDKIVRDASYENLNSVDRQLADKLIDIKNNPSKDINPDVFHHDNVIDVTIIRLLFDNQKFLCIVKFKEYFSGQYSYGLETSALLYANIYYLIGLSCFNCQMFTEAMEYLAKAYEKDCSEIKLYFYNVAKITNILNKENINNNDKETLQILYGQCKKIVTEQPSIKEENIDIWVIINLRYFLYVDMACFENYYSSLSNDHKEKMYVIYYYARFLIAKHEYVNAVEQLNRLEPSDQIIFLKFWCYLQLKDYWNIVECYENIKITVNSPKITGVYLVALNLIDKKKFKLIADQILESNLDVETIVEIFGIVAENEEVYGNYFKGDLIKKLDYDKLRDNPDVRNIILHLSLKNNDLEVATNVLESYNKNDDKLNESIGKTIFRDLENTKLSSKIVIGISTLFIEAKLLVNDFLLLRSYHLWKTNQVTKALSDIEVRYNNLSDKISAEHAVGYLLQLNEFRYEKYSKYINTLINTQDAFSYSMLAIVYMHLNDATLCKEYAYKCLYLATDDITSEVADNYFRSFLGYANDNAKIEYETVEENTVVYCKDNNNCEVRFCFEKGDFYKGCEYNNSFNVKHIGESNPNYYTSLDYKIGEHIIVDKREYRILRVVSKYVYAFWFMLELLDENSKKYGRYFKKLTGDTPELLLKNIGEMIFDNSQASENLRKYHFEEPGFENVGLPLDCISEYGYGNYIRVIKYLLFHKGEAFYSGINDNKVDSQKYVFTLSTLVILSLFGWMDFFDKIKESVIVPESFIEFINNCRARAHQNKSQGYLHAAVDGKIIFEEKDGSTNKVWDEIYERIYNCQRVVIKENERKNAIIGEGDSLENLLTGFNIDVSNIDCIILAQKENLTLVCDDLFVRKICALIDVDTVNTSFLISHFLDNKDILERIVQLAKSNYTYLGYDLITYALIQKIDVFGILLDGDRKSQYYIPYLSTLNRMITAFLGKVLK